MTLPRVYYPHPLQLASLITLNQAASHHLLTVLRLQTGEPLQLFNGEAGAYAAVLADSQKKLAVVEIKEFIATERESPLLIHLGQAISRGERMDYTVQKSVELGVKRITPLFTERCGVQLNAERAQNRVAHWQKIAINASEQCGRCRITTIDNPQTLAGFFAQATGLRLICSLFATPQILPPPTTPVTQITLLIGPEGGFAPHELAQAQQAGFHPLSLGPRILRTETAAVVALTLLQNRWGDLPSSDRQ